ncbi:hypothetical protein DSOUD_1604 [Desulfuromonas soudanensis]|uniref:Uncharacterized protein n=1 Tax=Desulfuromonas soudanensis TaxID=1603606 RepID=A0A0M4DHS4_9BACT|nr:hypothetical protein [Desulfuromonas soudanensis]ALC16382.1 hypothetical protein DSOUD_1604 [Desulfuromonas soudanensis]
MAKHDDDNRSNQLNPNNDAYYSSREGYGDDDDGYDHVDKFSAGLVHNQSSFGLVDESGEDTIELLYRTYNCKVYCINSVGVLKCCVIGSVCKQSLLKLVGYFESTGIKYLSIVDDGEKIFEKKASYVLEKFVAESVLNVVLAGEQIRIHNKAIEKEKEHIDSIICDVIYDERNNKFIRYGSGFASIGIDGNHQAHIDVFSEIRNLNLALLPHGLIDDILIDEDGIRKRVGVSLKFWKSMGELVDLQNGEAISIYPFRFERFESIEDFLGIDSINT